MILAFETSCDDSCVAVVGTDGTIYSNIVSSQHDLHSEFQGVVPELASRRHCEMITVVMKKALSEADTSLEEIQQVAVTYGPGLVGSLLTGIAAAKSVSARHNLPLIPVNHIEGHIYSIELEESVSYPYITLVASGGHTALFQVEGPNQFQILGHTQDDAAGEAYDKVAKMLDLGFPGGPAVETLAEEGNPNTYDFPCPTVTGSKRWSWSSENLDFSFSGLKTAVYYHLKEFPDSDPADVAASFQQAVNDTLAFKTIKAAREQGISTICLGGGVAANSHLRETFRNAPDADRFDFYFPSLAYCTDNAAMIGHRAREIDEQAGLDLNAQPNLSTFSPRDPRPEVISE